MRVVGERELAGRLGALPGPEPRIVVSGNFATPWELLRVLDGALERYRVFVLNPQHGWPRRPGVVTETPFVGPGARGDPSLDYLPLRLSLVPRLFGTSRPPHAVLLHTSLPRRGKVSLGIEVNILPAAIEHVRASGGLVVAQCNPAMPYTLGDSEVPLDAIDLVMEAEAPLPSPEPCALDDTNAAIGERLARFADDGCTIQLGIGQIPDAAASHLGARRGLGVWSEMVSDGLLDLHRAGALDPRRPIRASFLFGSPELYQWASDNPDLQMVRTEIVNDPARIAANRAMVSFNSALHLDLFDQANATYVRHAVYSGFGGQPDFVVGALHSVGGHALMGLRSWHHKTERSTIVPVLDTPVTSFQHSAVVTEHGCAELFGRSQPAQASLIIERCAHPDAREHLRARAADLGVARRPGAD